MTGDTATPELPPGLLEEYLAGMRATLGDLAALAERLARAGNDRGALDALQGETHKIHGSAGSYGFTQASRLAAGMEATLKDWVARPDDPEVDRGSLARWFVTRLAEMLGLPVPRPPGAAPPLRVGSPPRPGRPQPGKPALQPPAVAPRNPQAPAVPRPPAPAPPLPSRRPAASPAPAPAATPSAPPPKPQPRPPSPPPVTPAMPAGRGDLPWLVPPSASPPPTSPPPVVPPKPAPPAPEPKPAVRPSPIAAAPPAPPVPEVIFVEDDPALAELLAYGLQAQGYRFSAHRNGREALRELLALDVQGAHPLLLLDVDLPALDGYSIFEALQRERPGTYRVVFTTVHGTEEEQLRGLEAGALDYLVKPISLRVALEKIKRWVGR